MPDKDRSVRGQNWGPIGENHCNSKNIYVLAHVCKNKIDVLFFFLSKFPPIPEHLKEKLGLW